MPRICLKVANAQMRQAQPRSGAKQAAAAAARRRSVREKRRSICVLAGGAYKSHCAMCATPTRWNSPGSRQRHYQAFRNVGAEQRSLAAGMAVTPPDQGLEREPPIFAFRKGLHFPLYL